MEKIEKGYLISSGYMGYIPSKGTYMLFPTEQEYHEAMKEEEDE